MWHTITAIRLFLFQLDFVLLLSQALLIAVFGYCHHSPSFTLFLLHFFSSFFPLSRRFQATATTTTMFVIVVDSSSFRPTVSRPLSYTFPPSDATRTSPSDFRFFFWGDPPLIKTIGKFDELSVTPL
jgi:hypothetical protein